MKLLFSHSHIFLCGPAGIHSDKLPYSAWRRYLRHFNEIVVLSRGADATGSDLALPLSSGPRVGFCLPAQLPGPFGKGGSISISEVERLIRDSDAVVVRLPSVFGPRLFRLAQRLGKPCAVEVVGCAWDATWNHGSFLGRLFAPILYWQTRSVIARASHVFYVSSGFLQGRYPPARAISVGRASNVDIEDVLATSELKRRQERMQGETIRVGCIASLETKYKAVDDAIRALSIISKQGIAAELRILGGGDPSPYQQLARKLEIADAVIFEGRRDKSEVIKWLDELDIYIQPSLQEGVPRAVIEAMSRGLPCVGSTAGGIPELLDKRWLVPPSNYRELARRITELAKNPALRSIVGRANLNIARKFSRKILEPERNKFWLDFAEYSRERCTRMQS